MRIELTVRYRSAEADVVVMAPAAAALATVLPSLAAAVGAAHDVPAWHGDQLLQPTTAVGESALRVGSVVEFGRAPVRPRRPGVLSVQVAGGPSAGGVVALERGRISVGRAADCDLVLADPDVSRHHAVLDVGSSAVLVRDLGSTNGTCVDGVRVGADGCAVQAGSELRIGDSLLMIRGPLEAPASLQASAGGTALLRRPPRQRHRISGREIALPTKPPTARPRAVQWVAALLPAAAGAGLAWFAHSPQFLLFALLSPVMLLSTALGDRLSWRRSRRRDRASFQKRVVATEQEIARCLAIETASRRDAAPDAPTLLAHARLPGSRLWERRRVDDDMLQVRLGTAELPSALKTRSADGTASAGQLPAVPLCVDLRRGPLGIAAPAEVGAGLARWVVGQLAALHSPTDVQLAMLLDEAHAHEWEWARWLPHLADRVASRDDEWVGLVGEVQAVIDRRTAHGRLAADAWPGPWLVVVVDRAGRIPDMPGLAAALTAGSAVGVTALFVDTDAAALPTCCAAVARADGVTGTRVKLRELASGTQTVGTVDRVSTEWAEDLARSLAPLLDAEAPAGSALPRACGLVESLDLVPGADAIEARWASAGDGARSVVGIGADGPFEVDLARDGPHVLVAGTTGAGKSELLRTLVAGLACNHPPDELVFLLIDYKGGAAFAECAQLPHTTAAVTDLDPCLTERALRSLDSELRHRERVFADAGAADLVAYRARGSGSPVPRLIIVVDEFATLKQELPDFVRGLVSVAQRGRSLGVHLILATQRPGTAVSADIRANTGLRFALRVTDPSESIDVIDSPDAAAIPRSCPGRAYLRVGDELTCFQSAHASVPAADDRDRIDVEPLGAWRRKRPPRADADTKTELARIVDAIQTAAARSGRHPAGSIWQPPLPEVLARSDLPKSTKTSDVPFALLDRPDEQRIDVLRFGAGSSLLVCGAARSGRTSTLLSLALGAVEQLDPAHLELYIIDAVGGLYSHVRELPHTATALGPDELALAPRLLQRLEATTARRSGDGLSPGATRAQRLLLIDGWDALQAALPDLDALGCHDALSGVLRFGPSAGVGLAVAGDRSMLAPRFSGAFVERIALRLTDRADYGLVGIRPRDVPATLPAGRGLHAPDGAVVQIAHAGTDHSDVRRTVERVRRSRAGAELRADAIRMRPLPTTVELTQLPARAGRLVLGVAGDTLEPIALDPFAGARRMLVAGPPRSGRSTVLRVLAEQAAAAHMRILVAASHRSPLSALARQLSVPVVSPSDNGVEDIPRMPTLVLVDDGEAFTDTPVGESLAHWARSIDAPVAMAVAGRPDELATSYRGLGAEVRRNHCGILLRPGPVDGELLGVRLPRRPGGGPPGRGVAVGDATWGPLFESGEPVPIQVAVP